MDKRRHFEHQDHHRPDRSRSPLQRKHPWDKAGEPKSVLYSVEVQFHRKSPNKYTHCHRSPSKPSSSKSPDCSSSMPSKAPLKELPQANRSRASVQPQARDPDASVQRLVEKLQKWNSMYSPPKFMAGMMSADGVYDLPKETTPKRRSNGPWFVEYYTKTADGSQQQKPRRESHPTRENIIRIEKENRRTDECLAGRSKADRTPSPHQYSRPDLAAEGSRNAVETDADGYAIPSTERRCGPATPLSRKFEAASFMTPAATTSPNDEFFTPMTHLKPREDMRSKSVEAFHPMSGPKFTPDPQKPRFSFINENGPSSSPFVRRDTSIKERTESQLAAYDKVSSKLDMALREANEVLNRPIKLCLPPLSNNSNLPAFSDGRQTIDSSQMENLRDKACDRSPRRSLPLKTREDRDSSGLSRTFVVPQDEQQDTSGAYAVSPVREKQKKLSNQQQRSDISLPKALGASMAAELAYAEKAQQVRTHLHATRRLANDVSRKADPNTVQEHDNDDIDRILDSICLRDESLLTYDQPKDESITRGPSIPAQAPRHASPKVVPSIGQRVLVLSAEERQQRKKKVEEYLRMCNVLRTLQHAVYKLKRRFTSSKEQLIKIDELSKAADIEYSEAIVEAKSWLSSRITQKEFLQLVERRKKKVYVDSEDCSNTIKQLLTAQAPVPAAKTISKTEEPSLTPPVATANELSPVRVDTRALNESVECDIWNLSARSLRRNLDARREQAEMLNRSFEERTKDIEQRTKESIAAQISKYDQVIAERTNLLSRLDEISSEENAALQRTPTPRRAGVEPLDLSQLSPEQTAPVLEEKLRGNLILDKPMEENSQNQDQADVGISRAYSQSTVYEDSLSHFDEEEESRSGSATSEATLYQSDLEDEPSQIPQYEQQDAHPSRRTLDTAETLAMLSRQVVTVVSDRTSRNEEEQILERIVEEATHLTFTTTQQNVDDVSESSVEGLQEAEALLSATFTIIDQEPVSKNDQEVQKEIPVEAEATESREEVGDIVTPCESTRIEVSIEKSMEVEAGAEQCLPEKNALHSDEVIVTVNITKSEEEIEKPSEKFVPISVNEEDSDFESTQWENSEAVSSPSQKSIEDLVAANDDTFFEDELDIQKESEDESIKKEYLSHDEDSLSALEAKEKQERNETEIVARTYAGADEREETSIKVEKTEEDISGWEADINKETLAKIESPGEDAKMPEESANTKDGELGSVATSSGALAIGPIVDETASEATEATPTTEDKPKTEEKRENDPYELSFLDRVPDRVVDGRVSLGLNRSELCDSLSTSIMQLMTDSPRRRSLPRSYNLSDSLLEDSVALTAPKSPRAPKERFNTKMPGPFSPRMQMLLENSLDTSIPNTLAEEAVKNVLTGDVLNELDKEVEGLAARVERRSATSPGHSFEETKVAPASPQNLFEQLDETYEDLLSIEKPTSQLHHVVSSVEPAVEELPSHVGDTPRKPPTPQVSPLTAEDIKQKRMEQLSEQVHSRDWMRKKCAQLLDTVWSRICSRGFIRPILDEFLPAPKLADDTVAEDEDERLLLENRTFTIWAAIIEMAAKIWPESSETGRYVSSKLHPIPKNKEEFAVKAEQYVLEKLSEMPPSHRYSRLSRPPPPPYVDTAVDRAVARRFYEEDSYAFARKVDAEYLKLCEELIDRVGDRFVTAELQRMHHRLVASGDDATPPTPSATSSERLSGEFGRPSLARLSLGSAVSVGRCSSSPLRVVHSGEES